MGLNPDVLEQSFRRVAPQGERLVARFYERLFEAYPAVKPLFRHTAMAEQRKKLLAAIGLVMQNLRHPQRLEPVLTKLGARHAGYGAQPAHYDAVAQTLLAVLEEFAGPAWTPVVKRAWSEALSSVKTIMLSGAEPERPASGRGVPFSHKGGDVMAGQTSRRTSKKGRAGAPGASTRNRDAMHFIKTALDGVNTNVLLCDRDCVITYINKTAQQKLKELEGEIRKVLPAFNADQIVGTCIDAFHQVPGRQRQILADPANLPHRADITLGPLTLNLRVGAVLSDDGEYLGNTLEWEDVTAKRRMETEMARLKTSLDNARTNVMVCDRTYTIVYVNKASERVLRTLEPEIRKVLPSFSVDRVVGSNIDQYHRSPAHQRRLLDDPRNLPYRSEITLGPLTLDLNASAIMSDTGEYLGNVVEWADVTAQKKAQDEVQRLIAAAVDGRLAERAPAEAFDGFYRALAEGINTMLDALVERLTKVVGAVKGATDNVSSGSRQISSGTQDLSQRTSEQASALEETSSAMEEMTSTVKQNADNAKQANQLALAARDVAENGGQVTAQAVAAMGEINKSSKKIADIITVIDEIAFQTNLLALNAAVEAARAGEHGRGFAVVAAEVRNLAQRSATAAKEIKSLINESVQKVTDGSDLVNQCGKTLGDIVTSVKRVTDIVSEISAASQEQASGIEQVNKAILQMDETTQQNAALVEESAAACQAMEGQAGKLMRLMDSFRMKDGCVAEMTTVAEEDEDLPARPAPGPAASRPATAGAKPAASAPCAGKRPAQGLRPGVAKGEPEKVGAAAGANGRNGHKALDGFEEF